MGDTRISGDGSTVYNGITVNTPYDNNANSGVKVDDFLQLMIAQMTNQDFMNPTDDSQYITQMAQFASMQAMQELSYYSQTNYVTGLVGKTVTVATLGLGGQVSKDTGVVSGVNLSSDSYTVTVNGKQYDLSQIMSVDMGKSNTTAEDISAANKMALYIQDERSNSLTFRWDAPVSDDDTLTYSVYYTTNGSLDFDSLNGVKQGTKDAEGLKKPEYTLNGLDPETTYFVNVVVRNQNGDEAIYKSSTLRTPAA